MGGSHRGVGRRPETAPHPRARLRRGAAAAAPGPGLRGARGPRLLRRRAGGARAQGGRPRPLAGQLAPGRSGPPSQGGPAPPSPPPRGGSPRPAAPPRAAGGPATARLGEAATLAAVRAALAGAPPSGITFVDLPNARVAASVDAARRLGAAVAASAGQLRAAQAKAGIDPDDLR